MNSLTSAQRATIRRARDLAAYRRTADVAAYIGATDTADPYPEAFGHAQVVITQLLEIIDGLTGGTP